MANIGEQLLQPESGMKRIDDAFYAIKYTGSSWTHFSNEDTNYNNGTGHSNNKKGEYYEIYCYTSKFNIIANYGDNLSNDIDVFVNSEKENISQYNSTTKTKICIFKKYFEKKQLIHIKVINNTNNYINFDCIDIDEDGYMVYCDDNNKLYYDVTPIMTSNTTPEGYEASAASNSQSLDPYMAFDGRIRSNDTYFYCTANKALTNQWLKLLSNSKIRISTILLISQIESFPKKVNIQGSNDNKNFTDLNAIDIDNTKTDVLIDLDNVCEYKTYRVQMNGSYHPNYIYIHELRFLLAVDTPFYIIKDNGVYKNYDEDSNSLIEIPDISILANDAVNNTCIYDLNKVLPLIDLTQDGINILCNKNKKHKIYGIQTDKEMIISRQNLSLLSAEKINTFKQIISKENNGNCKTVFSLNNGVTWKSYDVSTSQFIDLTNTLPLDLVVTTKPDDLSEENKTKWYDLQNEIAEKGMDANTMQTLDFATLLGDTYNNIRFAHVIIRPTYDDKVTLQNMSWNVDEKGDYVQTNDVEIAVNSNRLTATSTKENLQNIKVNLLI